MVTKSKITNYKEHNDNSNNNFLFQLGDSTIRKRRDKVQNYIFQLRDELF